MNIYIYICIYVYIYHVEMGYRTHTHTHMVNKNNPIASVTGVIIIILTVHQVNTIRVGYCFELSES